MGVVIRQSTKASIMSYIGVVLGAFITIWLFPKFLSIDEIGIYRIFISTGALLVIFAQLGIPYIIDRFFPKLQGEKANFIFFVILYTLLTFGLFSILFFAFPDLWKKLYEEKSPKLNDYYFHIWLFVFFLMWQGVLEALCRSQLKIVIPSLIKDVLTRILVISLTLCYAFLELDFEYFIFGIVSFYAFNCVMMTAYLLFLKSLKLTTRPPSLEEGVLAEIMKYGFFIMIGGASAVVINQIDVIMIGSMLSLSQAGIYTTVLFMAAVIEIPRRTIAVIATPIISKAWNDNDLIAIKKLYQQSSINQQLVGSILFLCIWCNIDSIFALIPNNTNFVAGKYVVLYIGLTKVIDMLMGVNNEIILQSKHYIFGLISNVFLAIMIILLNLYFIPINGINGAAIATLIAVIIYNLFRFVFLWWKYKMQPFQWSNLTLTVLTMGTYLLLWYLPTWEEYTIWLSFAQIVTRGLLIVALIGGLSLLLGISKEINALFRRYLF